MRSNPVNQVDPALCPTTTIGDDLKDLGAHLATKTANGPVRIAIDGMWGTNWERVVAELASSLDPDRYRTLSTEQALQHPETLQHHFQAWLTDNPVFGRVCQRPLADYFDPSAFAALTQEFAQHTDVDVVFLVGPNAISPEAARVADVCLFCDLPRPDIIAAQNAGRIGSMGGLSGADPYKIAYYVEWPLLETHRRSVLSTIDYYISLHADEPRWVHRSDLCALLRALSCRPFRCTPFFMPGVWGGHRLQAVAGISPDWPNCAWDFEIVAPENAVCIGLRDRSITVPFSLLMSEQAGAVMGAQAVSWFGEYFPIRFNYLDTMGGTNLSCQVHPHAAYIHEHFNEPIGQDESYYIVENRSGAKVYLGFRESISRQVFQDAVEKAEQHAVPFEIADYLNAWDTVPGDLFLIPSGTIHCSGANNLVLEISATPYWYTFKLYDYLRPDLSGKPRPINASFGFDVLDFARTTDWVKRNLMPAPVLLRRETGGSETHIGSSPLTFYGINRLDIEGTVLDDTRSSFHILTVVAGSGVEIVSEEDPTVRIPQHYLETFLIPAQFGRYRLQAIGGACQVVKAYLKQ